nr:hypothetical protein CFP56_78685 [Quercus suber]
MQIRLRSSNRPLRSVLPLFFVIILHCQIILVQTPTEGSLLASSEEQQPPVAADDPAVDEPRAPDPNCTDGDEAAQLSMEGSTKRKLEFPYGDTVIVDSELEEDDWEEGEEKSQELHEKANGSERYRVLPASMAQEENRAEGVKNNRGVIGKEVTILDVLKMLKQRCDDEEEKADGLKSVLFHHHFFNNFNQSPSSNQQPHRYPYNWGRERVAGRPPDHRRPPVAAVLPSWREVFGRVDGKLLYVWVKRLLTVMKKKRV